MDAEEFYGSWIDGTNLFNEKLQEWENFHNFDRPLGGLNGLTSTNDYD